jgi:uncharacterized protein YjbI with pentapeptide repeats
MADEKQLEILKQGAEDWNRWRKHNTKVNINLSRADLSGAKLNQADLSGVNLRGATLIGTDLSRADLSEAKLSEAKLNRADLSEAKLNRADLSGAKLNQAKLSGANLYGANLSHADLGEAYLWGADLTGANLMGADLTGANLSEAFLRRADLSRARLYGATFSRADLIEANLSEAKLSKAQLSGANLRGATLIEADLSEANLRKANLSRANLSQANLNQANLTECKIAWTVFGDNDLSVTLGLATASHAAPSILGHHTTINSKGKIPIEFLRGCGLSDLDIECAKIAAPGLDPEQVAQITYEIHRLYCDQPIQFYSCFISYNSKDHEFSQRLHDDLQNNGVRCWFAPEDMKIGDEFRSAIGKEIRIRDKLLIILSENSVRSEWVGDEVEKALTEEKEQKTLKLFPIRLDDAVLKAKDDWAEKIRLRRHIGDFSDDYTKAFERLLRDLKSQ